MPRKNFDVVQASSQKVNKACSFCGLKDDNELEYGKFHEYDGIVTHYYCLLFSSNMQQQGQDDEGILGFLTEDINKELKRGKRLACCYCKKIGATLGCCNIKCKRIFHFPCGLKAGSLHQFFGEFKSFCKTHRPIQTIDKRILQDVKDRETICYICYDNVNPHDPYGTLWAPCCKKNAWFHRTCVQQLAMSAGYFFKCPLCNNKNEFQKAMLDYGIFIPSQDASWELVPNAFEELLYRHNRCDAPKCLCPKGREHVSTNAKWELTLCRTCGSQGIHMACGSLKWVKPVWECSECTLILNKSVTNNTNGKPSLRRLRNNPSPQNDYNLLTDDESSDSDISVGGLPDLRTQVSVDPQRKSEPSPTRYQKPTETQDDLEENRVSTRCSRRSSLARSATTNFTSNHEPTKINSPLDEELAPLPKKPRIQLPAISAKAQETDDNSDDSDDDIMVISGPSRSESSNDSTNQAKSPVAQFERVFIDPPSPEMLKEIESPMSTNIHQRKSIINEKCRTPSKFPSETSSKTESRVTKRPSLGPTRPPPVEIDLSDGEIIVQEKLASFETNRTSDSFNEIPEMNIKISNVTSLAPGAFDFDSEPNIQLGEAMNNHSARNTGLTSQDPIILDEKSAPLKPSQNNNMHIDELTIVRFEGVTTVSGDQGKSIIYGLTIPGTKHTVPFIVTPPENCTSETPGIHVDPKSPLGIALCDCNSSRPPSFADLLKLSVFNGSAPNCIMSNSLTAEKTVNPNISRKPVNPSSTNSTAISTKQIERSSRQNAERFSKHDVERSMKRNLQRSMQQHVEKTTVQNVEEPAAPQSIDPKLWSVPLKSIVKGTMNSNLERSGSIANDGTENYASFVRINESFVPPKMTVTVQAKPILPNSNGSSATVVRSSNTVLQKPDAVARGNMLMPNELALDVRNFAPSRSSPASEINITPVNGVVPSAKVKSTKYLPGPKHSKSNVWAKVNGSYVPIEPNVAEDLNLTMKTAPSQLPIPPPIDHNLPMFRFINTEQSANESSNNCDGDAGSGPAVQPTSVNPTNARRRRAPGPASFRRARAAYDDWDYVEGTNERWSDCHKTTTAECSATTEGNPSCDRAGLIHETINLRDIKFKVGGPNIVQMTLYDTYNVNIKVDTTSRCKYETPNCVPDHDSSIHRRSSLSPEAEISKPTNCDSLQHASSVINHCWNYRNSSSNDTEPRQSESNFESNVSTLESVTNQSQMDVSSRGQDELKENRDPVPPSTNSMNTTSAVERKSKTRPCIGVNHSMRFLNEKEIQETTSEKIDGSPQKIGANDSQLISNSPRISYNGSGDTNESRKLVSSIETGINKSAVSRNSNDSDNANIIEKFETAQRLKMSIKDENPSDTRELVESTNDTKNYDSSTIKSLNKKVKSPEISATIEATHRRRKSVKNEGFDSPQNCAKLKTTDNSKSFKFTKTKSLINNSNDADIARNFDAAKRRRMSPNDKHSKEKSPEKITNTNDSKNRIRMKINPLVNSVARSKRKSMDHVSRSSKFNVNNIFENGKTVANSESLCCKVSIDLTRVRQILATKLKVSVDVKFHERNDECFAKDVNGKNVSKSFRKRKAYLTRSRSFHHLERLDHPRIDRTSILEFRRSKSVDNDCSSSFQHRCPNGIIRENGRNSCNPMTRILEKHDCIR